MIENSGAAPAHDANRDEFAKEGNVPREGWLSAILGLIESRVGIIILELKEAFNNGLAKLVPLLICLFCAFATWTLMVVASIGCLASATEWKWYQITFATAGLHIVIAITAFLIAKKKKPALFLVTRSEFEKDRKWLNQLKNRNK